MALGAEGGDGFDIALADIGVISFRKWGGFFSPASAAVSAVGVRFFAEVGEKAANGTAWG
jgi:hypothetical protein